MTSEEIILSIAKYDAYQGKRGLSIRDIRLERDATDGRELLDYSKIEPLRQIFASHGCHSRDYPVIVRKMQDHYICLDGKHRLAAARVFLDPEEQFWPAHIYETDDISLLNYLSSGLVLQPFSDGDLYRIIRFYESRMDHATAGEWRAKLSRTKGRCMKFLDKAVVSNNRTLADCFDRLLPYPGLWPGFMMGTHRLESLRCHEEVGNYLDRIYRTWSTIFGDNPELATVSTIQRLENRYPELSLEDSVYINNMWSRGEIFECLQDRSDWSFATRCLEHKGKLSTLNSLMDDSKLLAITAEVMKLLVPRSPRHTLRHILYHQYCGPEGTFGDAYHRLWIHAWREFPDICTGTQLRLRGKGRHQPVDGAEKFAQLVTLAKQLHFTLEGVSIDLDHGIEESIASFLRTTLQDRYCPSEVIMTSIQKIRPILMECIEAAQPTLQGLPVFTLNDSRLQDTERSGIPFALSFMQNRALIDWEILSCPHWILIAQQYVSTFAILHDQFRSFFAIENVAS